MHVYFIIYKPFQVLSQFTTTDQKQTLADVLKVAQDVYPVGRLDYDSEGLLILTNDKKLNQLLLSPTRKHEREYWVQVEGEANQDHLRRLEKGVDISIDGKSYRTKNCKASAFDSDPDVPPRNPPIRFRKNVPTSWIALTLTEGKNRQVRKMTASVGLPTLRLIRYRIESVTIDRLSPGDVVELSGERLYRALFK